MNQLTRSSALGDSPPDRAVSPWERFKNTDFLDSAPIYIDYKGLGGGQGFYLRKAK